MNSDPDIAQQLPMLLGPPPASSGSVTSVMDPTTLQEAVDAAQPGDILELEPAVVYPHLVIGANPAGSAWVTIRSKDFASLPEGARVRPSDAAHMAVIEGVGVSDYPALAIQPGAHGFHLIGVELKPDGEVTALSRLVQIGDATTTDPSSIPYDVVLDRVYIHSPNAPVSIGIEANGRSIQILDSYIAGIHSKTSLSRGIAAWNGSGPFKIANSFVEAAGINVSVGEYADPASPNLVPGDVELTDDHLFKDPNWFASEMTSSALVLGNASRVVVRCNVFENQQGSVYAIRIDPRTLGAVDDVTIAANVVRHVSGGISIKALQGEATHRLVITNNLFHSIGDGPQDQRYLFYVDDGPVGLRIEHNTGFAPEGIVHASGPALTTNFLFLNNLVAHGNFGIYGNGQMPGDPSLTLYFPGADFRHNVIIGVPASVTYPMDNYFPASMADVGFVDAPNDNYRLGASSPYKGKATDSRDPGADFDVLDALTGVAETNP